MTSRPADHTDDVNGIVVGDITFPYEFHMPEEITPGYFVDRCVGRGHFANDAEAVTWFKANFSVEFAHGVEMRVFDQ